SGNGVVSAYDAGLVSEFAVQSLDHLPVATTNSSDWKFLSCATYPSCSAPSYAYTPISQSESANFYALLYGDVSGNWSGAATSPAPMSTPERAAIDHDRSFAAKLAAEPRTKTQRLTSTRPVGLYVESTGIKGSRQRVYYVGVQGSDGVQGLDLALDYHPSKLRIDIDGVQAV